MNEPPDTYQKARQLNLANDWYGTLAEIGAGEETTRWLFHVGGAAGTIAKSISAYDMNISDAIYGKSPRYVSRARLNQMLDHEYDRLTGLLSEKQNDRRFFVFANTVTAKSHSHPGPGRGWVGVRFQGKRGQPPSDVVIHIHLHDAENTQQQEALGIVGINLLYAAYQLADRPADLIASLMDSLDRDRLEVDMIDFTGPAAQGVDKRLTTLELVQRGLTDAAMFTAAGQTVDLADYFHHKPVLIQRGTFRPIIQPVEHMMQAVRKRVVDSSDGPTEPVMVSEMNLQSIRFDDRLHRRDLMQRLELLQELGRDVMISNFREHYRLVELLCQYTQEKIAVVLGAVTLKLLFDPGYYTELPGGVLEAMGRLFKRNVSCFAYPFRDADSGQVTTADNIDVGKHQGLYRYLLDRQAIQPLKPEDPQYLDLFPDDVLALIRDDAPGWRALVPKAVADRIVKHRLFGFGSAQPSEQV